MQIRIIFISALFAAMAACNGQNRSNAADTKTQQPKLVGGPCQGCEAIFEYGDLRLSSTDTLPDYAHNNPKLKLTGRVLEKDGKTPARNVIQYIYHTDRKGIYPKKGDEKGWAKRHGYIRGWIKTGKDGRYTFYTFRPGAYPNRGEPEHIHVTVKEPNKNEYYIDDFVFDDDPLLSKNKRAGLRLRGGSGVSKPVMENGMLTVHRDIILGENIPDYD